MSSQRVRRALCPGSFDPVTNGHLDIISRCAALYDEVVVAVFINQSKSSLFTVDERREMLIEGTAAYPNVIIETFQGLVVDYCRTRHKAEFGADLLLLGSGDFKQTAKLDGQLQGEAALAHHH